jgi:hypothetical protein
MGFPLPTKEDNHVTASRASSVTTNPTTYHAKPLYLNARHYFLDAQQ